MSDHIKDPVILAVRVSGGGAEVPENGTTPARNVDIKGTAEPTGHVTLDNIETGDQLGGVNPDENGQWVMEDVAVSPGVYTLKANDRGRSSNLWSFTVVLGP